MHITSRDLAQPIKRHPSLPTKLNGWDLNGPFIMASRKEQRRGRSEMCLQWTLAGCTILDVRCGAGLLCVCEHHIISSQTFPFII